MNKILSVETIERRIYLIRGQKVMLDLHLAKLYSVPTKSLNLAVKRNPLRFPKDFVFQLTEAEAKNLRLQIETSSWGGRRYLPYAFTEQGVAMLSSVLKSRRAALVNVEIMRAFVKLRNILALNTEFAQKLRELESRISKNELNIQTVSKVIRDLLNPPQEQEDLFEKPKRNIGFLKEKAAVYG